MANTLAVSKKRFRAALSFPGEKRDFIKQVADVLAGALGKDSVLYDDYLSAELARPNLDVYLGQLYHDHSELLVPFFCAEYERKEWCGLEWRQMRDIIKRKGDEFIMPFRFDDTPIAGVLSIDGYIRIDQRTPHEIAELILQRLRGPQLKVAPTDFRIAPSRLTCGAEKLLGREDDLKCIDDTWTDCKTHILTIVAWGGVGKTSLIVEWMNRKAAEGWPSFERVFDWSFHSQGTREQGATSADAFVAEALKFFGDETLAKSPTAPWEKGARLAQLIATRRSLVVLDGLEPLQHPPGFLTGQLKDPAIDALLKGLARQKNPGLCIVTTRERVGELAPFCGTTAKEWKLKHLSTAAGAEMLKTLGVRGTTEEFEKLVNDVKGHALTLNLLGRFLAQAFHGDIRKRDLVKFEEADAEEQGGHAFRVMEAYEKWFASGDEKSRCQLAVLRLLGLFDRPADAGCLAALRKPPAIPKLTDLIINLSEAQWNVTVSRLVECGLVSIKKTDDYFCPTFLAQPSLDTHPLIREYFAGQLQKKNPEAWKSVHRRVFEHLKDSTEQSPGTIQRLQPLLQAVTHGCKAGMRELVWRDVFVARIQRGGNYLTNSLGGFGAELATISSFFDPPWSRVSPEMSEGYRNAVLSTAANSLKASGRLTEAAALARTRYGMYLELSKHQPLVLRGFGTIMRVIAPWANRQGADVSQFVKASKQEDFLFSGRDLFEASFAFGQQLRNRAKTSFPLRCFLPIYDAYLRFITSHALKPLARLWQDRAVCMAQQSALSLLCGEVSDAMHEAERAVVFADNSSVNFTRMYVYSTLADAMHQARHGDALSRFREAEIIQGRDNPAYPLLCSVVGFQYCELLLSESERAAWQAHLGAMRLRRNDDQEQNNLGFTGISARTELTAVRKRLLEVHQRAAQGLKIARNNHWLRDIALDNLSLGRVALYRALLEQSTFTQARHHLFAAVEGLHHAGEMPNVPRGLLSRAWLRFLEGETNGAYADLDEAWQIAERGPMKLHMADILLHRARLFFRERTYPWKSPQDDLAAAEKLINDCGYHRRDQELAGAKKAILGL